MARTLGKYARYTVLKGYRLTLPPRSLPHPSGKLRKCP